MYSTDPSSSAEGVLCHLFRCGRHALTESPHHSQRRQGEGGAGTHTVTVEPTMTSASKTAFVQGPEVEALLHLDSKKLTSALLTVYV